MANLPISGLTASASNLASTDLAPVVQTVGVGPVKMTGLQLAGGLLGSTTFNGSTVTTSSPVLNLTQTWNAGAVTFTGLKFNAATGSNANSASGSLLLDLQLEGVSKLSVRKSGTITSGVASGSQILIGTYASINQGTNTGFYFTKETGGTQTFGVAPYDTVPSIKLPNTGAFYWASSTNLDLANNNQTTLTSPTTATLQLGAADVASGAVPQFLQVQSNTGAATTGPNFTIKGSAGTTAGGSIIFQTHNGTAYATALTINSSKDALFEGRLLSSGASQSGLQFFSGSSNQTSINYFIGGTSYPFATMGIIGGGTRILNLTSIGALTWSSNANADLNAFAPDLYIYRDAVGGSAPAALALKNSTNPQIFRAYSTTTGPSYGYFASGVTDAGVATADTLFIGTGGAGAAMTKLALVVNGTTRLDYNSTSTSQWFTPSAVNIGNMTNSTSAAYATMLYFSIPTFPNSYGHSIKGRSNGSGNANTAGLVFSIAPASSGTNDAFWMLGNQVFAFGGDTSSFPGLKRSGSTTTLQVRLADDSGDAAFQCGTQTAGGTAFNVNGTGGNSIASVTNTTTGTLLQVLNSTSNPLMTVTDTTSGTLFSVQSTTAATLFSVNDTTSGTLLAVTNSSSTDVFTVSDAGVGTFASNIIAGKIGTDATANCISLGSTILFNANNSVATLKIYNTGMNIHKDRVLGWGSSTVDTEDLLLGRVAARTLYVRGTSSTPGILSLATYSAAGTAITSASTAGAGAIAFASDATATTPRSTYASGGSNFVMLMSDGTNWLIVA